MPTIIIIERELVKQQQQQHYVNEIPPITLKKGEKPKEYQLIDMQRSFFRFFVERMMASQQSPSKVPSQLEMLRSMQADGLEENK